VKSSELARPESLLTHTCVAFSGVDAVHAAQLVGQFYAATLSRSTFGVEMAESVTAVGAKGLEVRHHATPAKTQ
jgi:3-deoxy-D-manno-octulosonic acid (KDO) 8-phosphate synthase